MVHPEGQSSEVRPRLGCNVPTCEGQGCSRGYRIVGVGEGRIQEVDVGRTYTQTLVVMVSDYVLSHSGSVT